jgi:RHH-type proline utilization regulon transcriptional repressor/proline dehydrogenase/delta 1-pyrroline-5-carboxylate dehydrogenase
MGTVTVARRDLEESVAAIGAELFAKMPTPARWSPARAERSLTELLTADPGLRAALFRFVDVRPACASPADLARHLTDLLAGATDSARARRASRLLASPRLARPTAVAAAAGVSRIARRFIVGEDVSAAIAPIAQLWRDGVANTVDLLGEATVSEPEADRYAERCRQALLRLDGPAGSWSHAALLDADRSGITPRVNLSVKVSALTSEMRAAAPERGADGARPRVRELMRLARDLDAHLHIDMESFDTRETTGRIVRQVLEETEFGGGPSCGIVLQAYLSDSLEQLDEWVQWAHAHPRGQPLTVRLVKGAYWDHEMIAAAQHGWSPPVFTDRRSCDRNFELLTRRLLDCVPLLRPAIASHNLRSIAHAAAYAQALGLDRRDVEFQVLRGLGDDVQAALVATGRRVRCYCPVGDLVSGMAYLVRRLLENTANDSFLVARARGTELKTLLAAP